MKAMILAAGEGSRLRPLTDRLPKPMAPLGGRPLLAYTIELLARHGVRDVAINLHHCPNTIRSCFGAGEAWGLHIRYSFEPELLGTAGAVKKLEPFWDEPFFVVYGDNLTDCDLTRLAAFHQAHGGIATIALYWREDVQHSGVATLGADDQITGFVEKPRPGSVESHWVNAGLLVAEPRLLAAIPDQMPVDFGRQVLPALIAQGEPVYGYRMTERLWWIDTLDDYHELQSQFQQGLIKL